MIARFSSDENAPPAKNSRNAMAVSTCFRGRSWPCALVRISSRACAVGAVAAARAAPSAAAMKNARLRWSTIETSSSEHFPGPYVAEVLHSDADVVQQAGLSLGHGPIGKGHAHRLQRAPI